MRKFSQGPISFLKGWKCPEIESKQASPELPELELPSAVRLTGVVKMTIVYRETLQLEEKPGNLPNRPGLNRQMPNFGGIPVIGRTAH